MYRLTRKGWDYLAAVDSSVRRGWHPNMKARVLLDIGRGRQPLEPALFEGRMRGEEGFTEYLYGLESLVNSGYVEEVEE